MVLKSKLPPIQHFKNVVVVPLVSKSTDQRQICGPIWPDWGSQTLARQCFHGKPNDDCPALPSKIDVFIDQPLFWAGTVHHHFGHFSAEHVHRILQSLQYDKSRQFLFSCFNRAQARTGSVRSAPPYFLPVTKWFGLAPEQIIFCTENMKVANLSVAPQAEQLMGFRGGPDHPLVSEEYLDLLDQNTRRNKLVPVKNNIVFVSRSQLGLPQEFHAGSRYLDAILESLGIFVFHPQKHSIEEQLAIYAGAERLIFSEGSAIHVLQFLGRGRKLVSVLNRRQKGRVAEASIRPRCEELQYIDAIDDILFFKDPNNLSRNIFAKAIFDTGKLFDHFKDIGIEISAVWDNNSYRQAVEEDIISWIDFFSKICLRRWKTIGDQSELIAALENAGFQKASTLVNELRKIGA